ncbi:hypothetical protein [Deinococcus apachensis]|uniref:hypothetical protein n=1 Tax=Deinococcus apachensis TaxID=309886 RepID=UPI00036529A9|nr:hypothetical protein [Deinococcus apachensis]
MKRNLVNTVALTLGVLITPAAATTPYAPQPTLGQLLQVRNAVAPFENMNAALAAGYGKFMDCMSGPQGAQGVHYTHAALIEDPRLDPLHPEALMYEPRADGSLRLVGVEYIVFQKAWHDAGHKAAPTLLGREFSLNTTLLPQPFYALHLWAWQHNPLELFANWNPLVICPTPGAAHAHSD